MLSQEISYKSNGNFEKESILLLKSENGIFTKPHDKTKVATGILADAKSIIDKIGD